MVHVKRWARTSVMAVVFAMVFALGFARNAGAGGEAQPAFLGTGGPCYLNYRLTSAGSSGWYAVVITDGAGQPLDVDYLNVTGVGTTFNDFADLNAINTISTVPVTLRTYYHISAPPAAHLANPDTLASYAFATSISPSYVGPRTIDPTPIIGTCAASDGRINPQPGATVAIYCLDDGGFEIWGINQTTGQGFPAIRMTAADIAAVPEHPASNLLVREFGDIRLYRLTTGEWQVNRGPDFEGKTYVYIWRNCRDGGHQASFSLNNPPPAPMTAVNEVFAAIGQAVRTAFTRVFAAE